MSPFRIASVLSLALFLALFLAPPGLPSATAQPAASEDGLWQRLGGPYGGDVNLAVGRGDTLYAGIRDVGVFRQAPGADAWTFVDRVASTGFSAFTFFSTPGGRLLAQAGRGLRASSDGGRTWSRAEAWADSGEGNRRQFWVNLSFVKPIGETLYAGSVYGLARSTDDGRSWTLVFEPGDRHGRGVSYVTRLSDGTLLATARDRDENYLDVDRLMRSDDGVQWEEAPTPDLTHAVAVVELPGGDLLASGLVRNPETYLNTAGLARSDDGGATWTSVPMPDLEDYSFEGGFVTLEDGTVYGVGQGNYYRWAPETQTFSPLLPPEPEGIRRYVYSLHRSGDTVLVGSSLGVYRSGDGGASWTFDNEGLRAVNTGHVFGTGDGATYAAGEDRFYRLAPGADAFAPLPLTVPVGSRFAPAPGGAVSFDVPELFRLDLEAATRTRLDSLPRYPDALQATGDVALFVIEDSTGTKQLMRHADGQTERVEVPGEGKLRRLAAGPDGFVLLDRGAITTIDGKKSRREGGLYRSRDGGQTFEAIDDPAFVTGYVNQTNLYQVAFGGPSQACTVEGPFWVTADGGATWASRPREGLVAKTSRGERDVRVEALAMSPAGDLYVGGREGGVYHLAPGAKVWRLLGDPFGVDVEALYVQPDGRLVVATRRRLVYRTRRPVTSSAAE